MRTKTRSLYLLSLAYLLVGQPFRSTTRKHSLVIYSLRKRKLTDDDVIQYGRRAYTEREAKPT